MSDLKSDLDAIRKDAEDWNNSPEGKQWWTAYDEGRIHGRFQERKIIADRIRRWIEEDAKRFEGKVDTGQMWRAEAWNRVVDALELTDERRE